MDVFKLFQVVLFALMILFIVMPVKIPPNIVSLVNSIYGLFILGFIILILFLFTHPILGVVAVFASYFLLLRSNEKEGKIKQTQESRNVELKQMNMVDNLNGEDDTLETDIIKKMSPIIPKSEPYNIIYSSYKPLNGPIGSASII